MLNGEAASSLTEPFAAIAETDTAEVPAEFTVATNKNVPAGFTAAIAPFNGFRLAGGGEIRVSAPVVGSTWKVRTVGESPPETEKKYCGAVPVCACVGTEAASEATRNSRPAEIRSNILWRGSGVV